jgi:hypothetical protein
MSVPSGSTALAPAIAKLIETLEDENAVLRVQRLVPHGGYTDRKNQALRELMAAQRRESHAAGTELRPELQKLSLVLKENARLLKLHIAAVGEISDIIVGSLKEADSDGTYSRSHIARGR